MLIAQNFAGIRLARRVARRARRAFSMRLSTDSLALLCITTLWPANNLGSISNAIGVVMIIGGIVAVALYFLRIYLLR